MITKYKITNLYKINDKPIWRVNENLIKVQYLHLLKHVWIYWENINMQSFKYFKEKKGPFKNLWEYFLNNQQRIWNNDKIFYFFRARENMHILFWIIVDIKMVTFYSRYKSEGSWERLCSQTSGSDILSVMVLWNNLSASWHLQWVADKNMTVMELASWNDPQTILS